MENNHQNYKLKDIRSKFSEKCNKIDKVFCTISEDLINKNVKQFTNEKLKVKTSS